VAEYLAIARDVCLILVSLLAIAGFWRLGAMSADFFRDMKQIVSLMVKVEQSIETQSERLGEALVSMRALTDAVRETNDYQIEPILKNLQKATDSLNDSLAEVSVVIEKGSKFSLDTIRKATVYRDRVFRPIIEAASLFSGARAVVRALPIPKPKLLRRK